MPTEYECPDCHSRVLVPNKAAAIIGRNEEIGCNNTEHHEHGDAIVMWEA